MKSVYLVTALLLSAAVGQAVSPVQPVPPAPNSLTPQEAGDGWVLLFDGETLFGWTRDGDADWHVENGVLAGAGAHGWLRTDAVFSHYLLKCEFRMGAKGPLPFSVGAKKKVAGGRWHSYEVNAAENGFVVTLNGKRLARGREAKDIAGSIGLSHIAGNQVEFRNIKLKPLGLEPIFNSKDLGGWHRVDRPNTKEPPEWSARDGMIHVEKGPGELESEGVWADFILQADIRANTQDPKRHPNSGVFVRTIPGQFWAGYEAQIRNEYAGEDRSKPIDYGTGAIYNRQPARRVVSNDNEFFTMTVLARGRRLMTWVNGYPTADFEDPNPEGENVRKKQARLAAGTIALQAHDPTTNLDFRNIRIVELPKK